MLSFMSVDRVEGDYVVCEVENITTLDSPTMDFCDKLDECFMAEIPKSMFYSKKLPIIQGMVYTVIHNGETIDEVHAIDRCEHARRVRELESLF